MLKPTSRTEARLLDKLDLNRLPRHIAIIMDGNGRWAQRRHLPRVAGHRAGVRAAREAIEATAKLGIEALTLYAFSMENWRRPPSEVDFLMRLLREYLRKELPTIHKNNIRLQIIGRLGQLPVGVQDDLEEAMKLTGGNSGMKLVVALNYGGRGEIVDSFNSILREMFGNGSAGLRQQSVGEDDISNHLYTAGLPDPDLLVRTSGEMRVSNFLLWQIAYAEIFVTDVLWPDFHVTSLLEALLEYQRRERRYGGLSQGRISQKEKKEKSRGS